MRAFLNTCKTAIAGRRFNLLQYLRQITLKRDQSGVLPSDCSSLPVIENLPAAATPGGDEDQTDPDQKEAWSLHQIRDYVSTNGNLIASNQEIDALTQSFGPVSKVDSDWKDSPSYPSPYIAELRDITVIPGCKILLAATGTALSDETYHGYRLFGLRPKRWDMDLTEGPFLHFKPFPLEEQQISSGIHLTGEHEANYFHWIVEILPRLFLFELLDRDKNIPLLVTEGLHENLYILLNNICAPQRSILKLRKDRQYDVARLIYPSEVSRIYDTYDRAPGVDTLFIPVNLIREMAVKIKKSLGSVALNSHSSIYIKRAASYRRLLNEMDIERMLEAKGFRIVEPGKLTIREQIDLFSQADRIIGPSGAAMVNMLWCKPGACITILHSDHPFKKYPYWDALARASEVSISYLAGPRAYNVTDMFEAHDDYTISLDSLAVALQEIGFETQ